MGDETTPLTGKAAAEEKQRLVEPRSRASQRSPVEEEDEVTVHFSK